MLFFPLLFFVSWQSLSIELLEYEFEVVFLGSLENISIRIFILAMMMT